MTVASSRRGPVLRILLAIVLTPLLAVLVWLSFGARAERADFVLTQSEPRTLDPHRASWLPEIQISAALFEGLTRLNSKTFLPEPAVAQRWEISEDRMQYRFHLRSDANWSDGSPVVAEDFRFGWLRVLDPASGAQYASLLFVIEGAEAYYRSRLDDDAANDLPADAVKITASGPHQLDVALGAPCSYFLDITSFITMAPVHRETIRRWAYRDGVVLRSTQHLWTRPEHIVCNGRFVLKDWSFKERIWLERNRQYWDDATTGVDTIESLILTDPNAALIAYETGRVDLVRWVERSVCEVLDRQQRAGERSDFYTGDRFATFFYRVNCRRAPLDNPDFRKALWLAIDRRAICNHIMRLGETPAYTYVPTTTLHLMPRTTPEGETVYYDPPRGLGQDLPDEERVALARTHLAQSGFGRTTERRPIEILVAPSDPEQGSVAEAIQAMWETTLGIEVVIRQLEGKVLSTRIRGLDYDLARSNWFGDYMDPSTFLDMYTSGSGQNRTGWSNPTYDRLIAAAAVEPHDGKRYRLLQEAERLLCNDGLPILTVFFRRGNYLLSEEFTGVHDNVRDLLQLHRVRPAAGGDG